MRFLIPSRASLNDGARVHREEAARRARFPMRRHMPTIEPSHSAMRDNSYELMNALVTVSRTSATEGPNSSAQVNRNLVSAAAQRKNCGIARASLGRADRIDTGEVTVLMRGSTYTWIIASLQPFTRPACPGGFVGCPEESTQRTGKIGQKRQEISRLDPLGSTNDEFPRRLWLDCWCGCVCKNGMVAPL